MTPRRIARASAPRAAPLDATMSARDALRALCAASLDQLRSNRARLLARGDAEALHQMRVALRRLRSALGAFKPLLPRAMLEARLAEIRWLSRALGGARDWDVFEASVLQPVLAAHRTQTGLLALRETATRLAARESSRAKRAAASRRCDRMLLRLEAFADQDRPALSAPVLPIAREALERRGDRVRKRGRGLAHLDAAELHRLRVAVKQLRYTALAFAPLFGARRTRATLGAVKEMQDALGGLNDCASAARLTRGLCAAARGAKTRRARERLGERIDELRHEHRRALRAAWKELRSAPRFWVLR